jgi:plastocyanin
MKSALSLTILTSLFCSTVTFAEVKAPDQGTMNVTVVDSNGNVVSDAPIYIYGVKRTHFVGGADVPGSSTFAMNEGEYRISSAMIQKSGDIVDRFASNEARITVAAGDHVSVVLTLKPIHNAEQDTASYATLHVAGLPGNQFNNN